jgi:hypothetical protein
MFRQMAHLALSGGSTNHSIGKPVNVISLPAQTKFMMPKRKQNDRSFNEDERLTEVEKGKVEV